MTMPPAPGEIRQLLVHPAVWPRLEAWLTAHGITITEVGVIGEDDLTTYAMTPTRLPVTAPAHDAGPTVAEAKADDAAYWDDRYAGEGK